MTHVDDALSSIPPSLRCHLCSKLLHRAVKSECCLKSRRRACRGCAVKFVTQSRRCWSCGAGNFKTSSLQNDQDMREAVEKYQATGEAPDIPEEDTDMEDVSDDKTPPDIDNIDMDVESSGHVSSVKRDADGLVKSSSLDQICSLPTKTTLYSNFTNVTLVRLSLQKKSDFVKVVFSKQFLKLLRENDCTLSDSSLAVNKKCSVVERNSQYFTFLHISFSHSANLKSKFEAGYHIANFVSLGNQKRENTLYQNHEVNLKVHQKTQVTAEPKICNINLYFSKHVKFDPEVLNSPLFYVHHIIGDSIELLNCFIKPSCKQSNGQITCQVLLRSKTGEPVSMSPGQLIAKATGKIDNISLDKMISLQELSNCDEDEDEIDQKYIDSLEKNERAKMADEKKMEGNSYFAKRFYHKAIKKYSISILLEENNAAYYGNRAACYLGLEDASNALSDAKRSVEIDPSYVKGWNRSCQAYILLGKLDKAMEMCDQILNISPNLSSFVSTEREKIFQIEKYGVEYKKAFECGNFELAVHQLNLIAQMSPKCDGNHILRAQLYAYRGGFEECRKILDENLCHISDNVEVRYIKAVLLYYQDNFDEADNLISVILTTDPDHEKTKKCRELLTNIRAKKDEGNALFKQEKYQEALDIYSEALVIDKFHARANAKLYCNRAACYSKVGKFSEAIDDCSKAIQLDKSYQKAFLRRAMAFIETEAFDQAVKDYEQLLSLDRSNQEYLDLLNDAKVKLHQSKNKDFYDIIGVAKTASLEEIKKAYRKAALVHHPDRHAVAEENIRAFHTRRFKEVGEAYSVLGDPGKRALYDQGRLNQAIQAQFSASAAAAAAVHAKVYAAAAAQAAGARMSGLRPGWVFVPGAGPQFVNIRGPSVQPGWGQPYQRRGFM